jgi:hypothetical protein
LLRSNNPDAKSILVAISSSHNSGGERAMMQSCSLVALILHVETAGWKLQDS